MDDGRIDEVMRLLERELAGGELPVVSQMAKERRDAFAILISTLLSLRTKDEVTAAAAARLLSLARTPQEMLGLSAAQIERAIYPVGFYRVKARHILACCRELLARFSGRVPAKLDELLTLSGVGRKTANLVLTEAFGGPGLCVDTHVHRISNRLGYVKTKTTAETECALRRKLPRRFWPRYNLLLVAFGRRTCRPVSPRCSACVLFPYCDRAGVTKSR